MDKRRGAAERLSHLQAAILAMVAEGERTGKGGAYGWGEIRRAVQRLGVTAYPGVSIRRAMLTLEAKGLIEPIPYVVRGEDSGALWGLSDRGRALMRTRHLLPPHLLAEGHPARIEVS